MKEYERKQLLERVEREGATVGVRIPETVDLQGEPFALREFVFEVKRLDEVPAADRERVDRAKKLLRRERLQRKQRLERDEDDMTREQGEDLVESIVGIDRALNALARLDVVDLEAEMRATEQADQKRWYSFLKRALGRDQDTAQRTR